MVCKNRRAPICSLALNKRYSFAASTLASSQADISQSGIRLREGSLKASMKDVEAIMKGAATSVPSAQTSHRLATSSIDQIEKPKGVCNLLEQKLGRRDF